jgi:hypothetical protein
MADSRGAKRAQDRFVEEMGLTTEADGLPRIAGRLFGLLLLSAEPLSLDEIAEALNVSKGSASTDARLLMSHGWLRRTTIAGDRKDYYELAPDFFAGIVEYRLRRWSALHDLVGATRPELGSDSPAVVERFRYLDQAQSFFVEGLRTLLAEWQNDAARQPLDDADVSE